MKTEKFVIMALERGMRFGDTPNGISFRVYRELAELTTHIDYGCKFDSHGRCKNYEYTPPEQSTMCCCNSCFYNMGYLKHLPTGGWTANPKYKLRDLDVYARHFSEKVIKKLRNGDRPIGFWRPNKGCVLPRGYRSQVCLDYTCSGESKTEWQKKLIWLLGSHITFPVTIRKRKYNARNVVGAMTAWRKEMDDKNNRK